MKIFTTFLILLLFTSAIVAQENASCKNFTQNSIDILIENDFLPDGKYNSIRLNQGDRIEVYKPFFMSKYYYLIVSADQDLPKIEVEVRDISRRVILKSDDPKSLHEFEFSPDRNQNLIISVKVIESDDFDSTIQGCVSIVVGFKI